MISAAISQVKTFALLIFLGGAYANAQGVAVGHSGGLGYVNNKNNTSLWFGTNNTEKVRIDTSGNVGIGTTTPGVALEQVGHYRMDGATAGYIDFSVPATTTTYSLIWPSAQSSGTKILQNDGSGNLSWAAAAASGVTSILASTGLSGGTITGVGTIAVDVGTAANKILQLTTGAQVPAVDGFLLTNVNATKLRSNNVATGTPAGSQVLMWNATTSQWNADTVTSASFSAMTSAQLAGIISDETGSGVLVYGTTPTFTTNLTSPLIIGGTGTTSTLTLKTTSGVGTTNADMIFQVGNNGATEAMRILNSGNVGIGTTTPNSKLEIDGAKNTTLLNLNMTNPTAVSDYLAIDFNRGGSQNVGRITAYLDSATQSGGLTFATAPDGSTISERMRINYAGNVGIGTTTPGVALEQMGHHRMDGATAGYIDFSVPATTTTYSLIWPSAQSSGTKILQNDGSGNLSWASAGSGVTSVLASTGLTGGTITGVGTLAVDVGTAANKILQLTTGAQVPAVDGFLLTNVNATKLRSNNVATGTPAGSQVLMWNATTSQWNADVVTSASFSTMTSAQLAGIISDETGSGALVFGTTPTITTNLTSPLIIGGTGTTSTLTLKTTSGVGTTNADMIFQVGNNGGTEAMRILNSGNVGIGTTTPSVTFQIASAATTGVAFKLEADDTGGHIYTIRSTGSTSSGGAGNFIITDATANVQRLTLDTSGNVGIGTTTPGEKLTVSGNVLASSFLYSSDRRLKTDIEPIGDALDKILKIHGVRYRWRSPSSEFENQKQIGVLAQDVEQVFPEAVVRSPQEGWLRVNYPALIGPIVEAIRDIVNTLTYQNSEIEKLTRKNEVLTEKLNRLEGIICTKAPETCSSEP